MPSARCRAKGRVSATASLPALEPRRRKAFNCFLLRAQTKSSCTHIAAFSSHVGGHTGPTLRILQS